MFEHLVALESRLDAAWPRPRLKGPAPASLIAIAHEWSDAVWNEAERLSPFAIAPDVVARGLEIARRPVFICGVHRSGTTLMQNLLDGHPALTVLPSEGSFYTNHRRHLSAIDPRAWRRFMSCEWSRRLANPINQPPYWTIGKSTVSHSPSVAFARAVAAWWPPMADAFSSSVSVWPLTAIALGYRSFGRAGAVDRRLQHWVEKTPTNEQLLADLWRDNPDAKVIHVIREPLAVLASRKRMEERATGRFSALRQAVADLAESYRIADAQRARHDGRYLLMRFEDLLEDSSAAIARVAAFVGIEDRRELHEPTVAGIPATSNSSFGERDAASIDRSRVHGDATTLSADERLRLAVGVGDAAAALGYTVPA